MSDRDTFIDEVSEEVRRDRMYALWRRWGPFVIGGIVAIVAAAGAKTWWDAQQQAAAEQAGGAVIAAGAAGDGSVDALLTLADQTENEGAAVLARLRAAGLLAQDGDRNAAIDAYRAAAAAAADQPLLAEFARLRAVLLEADGMSPDAAQDALSPFVAGGAPFRLLALEGQAAALMRAGDDEGAGDIFLSIVDEATAPQGLRQRALAALTALGIEPPAVADDAGSAEG